MTKFVWGIILLIALLCIIFLPSLSQPKQFHFGYVEQGYECYESSFNPHRVFEEWQLIHGELFSTTFIVVVGNPKIKWTDENKDVDQEIPSGQLTSTMMYVFQPRTDQLLALYMYGYKDKDGFINIYIWDSDADCYKKVTSTI